MNRLLILGGVLAVTLTLGAVVYISNNETDSSDLIAKESDLQGNLLRAKNKLNKEQSVLDAMFSSLRNFFAPQVSVQDQMNKFSNLANQTDFLFSDALGRDPEFILSSLYSIDINAERAKINALLSSWKAKADILAAEDMTIEMTEQIKAEAQIVQAFLQNLASALASLTPENSGLSQSEIDNYISQVPSAEVINEVLASLTRAVEDANTSSSDGSISNPPYSTEDVLAEQLLVASAEAEVVAIEEELAPVQEDLGLPTPTPTPVDSSFTPTPETETRSEE